MSQYPRIEINAPTLGREPYVRYASFLEAYGFLVWVISWGDKDTQLLTKLPAYPLGNGPWFGRAPKDANKYDNDSSVDDVYLSYH